MRCLRLSLAVAMLAAVVSPSAAQETLRPVKLVELTQQGLVEQRSFGILRTISVCPRRVRSSVIGMAHGKTKWTLSSPDQ